jgi:hypothetical protein
LARSIASLIPTPKLRHSLPALVFAAQSPYTGCQTIAYSRNVMRQFSKKFIDNLNHLLYNFIMFLLKKQIKILFIILMAFSLNTCNADKIFIELKNGNIIAPNGIEYMFFANEGFIETFGECKFLGKIKWEYPKLHHLGGSTNTGMYSCDDRNLDIIFRIKPNNEWRTYYRKASLPKIEFIPENCIRFEFIQGIKYYENNFSPEKRHITCNEDITNFDEIKLFLSDIKNEKSPKEAGLYKMITKENGMLENCYLIGCVYGFFDHESNFAIRYRVWSFNDLAYSINTNFGDYILSIEWLEKLGYRK